MKIGEAVSKLTRTSVVASRYRSTPLNESQPAPDTVTFDVGGGPAAGDNETPGLTETRSSLTPCRSQCFRRSCCLTSCVGGAGRGGLLVVLVFVEAFELGCEFEPAVEWLGGFAGLVYVAADGLAGLQLEHDPPGLFVHWAHGCCAGGCSHR